MLPLNCLDIIRTGHLQNNHYAILPNYLFWELLSINFLILGVKQGEACTVVLRGANKMIVDEAERSLHDALCVLTQTVKETRTVYGGGMHLTRIKHEPSYIMFIVTLNGNEIIVL